MDIASGYEMKASPVPDLITVVMSSIPKLWAKLPRMAKIVRPPIKLVNVSSVVTIIASLRHKIKSIGY